jgi:hypothetical protein
LVSNCATATSIPNTIQINALACKVSWLFARY